MIGCALDIVTVHVSDTGSGVHHSGADVLQREDSGQELKTIQKKETKHGFCFVTRTWMENGSDQMCDRIEQFLGYIGLTCQFLSLTPLHKCLYAMTISFLILL